MKKITNRAVCHSVFFLKLLDKHVSIHMQILLLQTTNESLYDESHSTNFKSEQIVFVCFLILMHYYSYMYCFVVFANNSSMISICNSVEYYDCLLISLMKMMSELDSFVMACDLFVLLKR